MVGRMDNDELNRRIAEQRVLLQHAASMTGVPVVEIAALYKVLAEDQFAEMEQLDNLLRPLILDLARIVPDSAVPRAMSLITQYEAGIRAMETTDPQQVAMAWLRARQPPSVP